MKFKNQIIVISSILIIIVLLSVLILVFQKHNFNYEGAISMDSYDGPKQEEIGAYIKSPSDGEELCNDVCDENYEITIFGKSGNDILKCHCTLSGNNTYWLLPR